MAIIKLINLLFLFGLVLFGVAACGSGGGGGGSSENARTGIRVLHGAIDYAPFDVLSNTEAPAILGTIPFAASNLYLGLSTGPQELLVTTTQKAGEVIGRYSIDVQKQERRSILVYGGNEIVPLQATLQLDGAGEISEGQSAVRVAHAAFGAAAISVSISAGAVSTDVAYGQFSNYLIVPSGPVQVELKRLSDGRVLSRTPLLLEPQSAVTILLAGEVDFLVTTTVFLD